MSLADWSPIATHAFSQGRTAFWLTDRSRTYVVVCDDGVHHTLYWTGGEWTEYGERAARCHRSEDAELELRSARRSTHETRREFVAVEES